MLTRELPPGFPRLDLLDLSVESLHFKLVLFLFVIITYYYLSQIITAEEVPSLFP